MQEINHADLFALFTYLTFAKTKHNRNYIYKHAKLSIQKLAILKLNPQNFNMKKLHHKLLKFFGQTFGLVVSIS